MAELKCPHCGQAFTVDDTELSSIIAQIRDGEFEKDLHKRLSEITRNMEEKHGIELEKNAAEIRLENEKKHEEEIGRLKEELQSEKDKNKELSAKLDNSEDRQKLAVSEAVKKLEDEKRDLEISLTTQKGEYEKNIEVQRGKYEKDLEVKKGEYERSLSAQKDKYEILLDEKEKTIELYKDMKTRMSTKMVGESLEQHCETEFNKIRMSAYPNAYFEKDNDARTGSKGDYIFKECDENGTEIISIMFEMKNEMDTTATKHKNEDFFKELDKDRREKGCEYAVLVSLLEADSELYNSGIVDVSYKYDKMYVVRPQCFLPIISILRNAAYSALEYKQELAVVKNQNIDITNFEDRLLKFKDDFGRNYEIAHKHFDKAIDEIDKTIDHLQKVKKELQGSDNQLRIAENKVEDVSIKKLTRGNPTMQAMFAEVESRG